MNNQVIELKKQEIELRKKKSRLIDELLGIEMDLSFSETRPEFRHHRAKAANRRMQISRVNEKMSQIHRQIQSPRLRRKK